MRKSLILLVLVFGLLALAACGNSNTSSSNQGSSQNQDSGQQQGSGEGQQESAQLERTSLTVGSSVRDIGMLPLYVADQKGFFKEQGLDVTVQYFDSGSQHAQALAAGAIDIGSGGFTEPMDAYVARRPIKAFWGLTNYPVYEWWASPDLKTLDDIKQKGKINVAVSRIGSLSHLISVYAFEGAGIDTDQYVNFVGLGGPGSRLAGLQSGQVDVIPATPPGNFILEEQGYNLLISLQDIIEEFQYEVHYASTDLLDNNPNTITAFLKGISKATDFIRENPEESADILSEVVGYKPEELPDVIKAVEVMGPYFPADGHFALEGVDVLLQFYKETGEFEEIPEHSELIDFSFTEKFQAN